MASSRPHRRATSTRTPASTFGSRTDVGCLRDHNEDSLVVSPPLFESIELLPREDVLARIDATMSEVFGG